MQAVSALGNEAANSDQMPVTVDTLGEIKGELGCFVLSPSLYMLIKLLFSMSVNSGF